MTGLGEHIGLGICVCLGHPKLPKHQRQPLSLWFTVILVQYFGGFFKKIIAVAFVAERSCTYHLSISKNVVSPVCPDHFGTQPYTVSPFQEQGLWTGGSRAESIFADLLL